MPNFELYLLVFIKELPQSFYLEHQTEFVLILVFLTFFAVAKTYNPYVIEIADALTRKVRHEVVEFVERNSSRKLLACVVNLGRAIKILLPIILLNVADK